MVAGKAYFAVIPPQICVGYAAARKKHSACKLSFRQQPEHRVRFFSEGRIAAPHNVCGTAAAASRLRHSLARQCLQGISSPQGNSTAGKNLRYSVLRDISRRRFKKNHNRNGALAPAARSGGPQKRKPCLIDTSPS